MTAQELFDLGYIPTSNRFLHASHAPFQGLAEKLAGGLAHIPEEVARYEKWPLRAQREQFARVFSRDTLTLDYTTFRQLRKLWQAAQ